MKLYKLDYRNLGTRCEHDLYLGTFSSIRKAKIYTRAHLLATGASGVRRLKWRNWGDYPDSENAYWVCESHDRRYYITDVTLNPEVTK